MISIVMPTYNRPVQLRNTLLSIEQQKKDVEIVVVDDGNDSDTPIICQSFGTKYIKINRPKTHVARTPAWPNNVGVRQAQGDIILLQNAECRHIDPNTITRLTSAVSDTNAVLAHVTALNKDGSVFMVYCGVENPRPYFFCGAIKKFWFEKLRGFDEDYADSGYDDDDFAARLKREGVQFEFTDVEVQHQWHEPAGVIEIAEAQLMYLQKLGEMQAGRLGTVRNLNREWGEIR